MPYRRTKPFLFSLLALTAAGCSNPPLLFTSAETVGINIAVSTASTNPLDITLGYKSLDASFVPVTVSYKSGRLDQIRSCYGTLVGSATSPPCPGTAGPASPPSGAGIPDADTSAVISPVEGMPYLVHDTAPTVLPAAMAPQFPMPFGNPGATPPNQGEAMNDALSVFSSFNTKANASSSTGAAAAIGKVFATGVAAQQLSEGQGYYLAYKGRALDNAASCLANLAALVTLTKATLDPTQIVAACGKSKTTTQ